MRWNEIILQKILTHRSEILIRGGCTSNEFTLRSKRTFQIRSWNWGVQKVVTKLSTVRRESASDLSTTITATTTTMTTTTQQQEPYTAKRTTSTQKQQMYFRNPNASTKKPHCRWQQRRRQRRQQHACSYNRNDNSNTGERKLIKTFVYQN